MDLAALVAAFAMIGDVLTAFGVTEAQLVGLARGARACSSPVLPSSTDAQRPAEPIRPFADAKNG
jgi:hypothetical protein